MLLESGFQPLQNNLKQLILLPDALIPQEAKDKLPLFLEGDYDSILLKPPMDVGRTNLFQMDLSIIGQPITHKPYPILLKLSMSC